MNGILNPFPSHSGVLDTAIGHMVYPESRDIIYDNPSNIKLLEVVLVALEKSMAGD